MHSEVSVSLFLHLGTYTPPNDVDNTLHSDPWPFSWILRIDFDYSRLIVHDAIDIGMWLWLNFERALNDSTQMITCGRSTRPYISSGADAMMMSAR